MIEKAEYFSKYIIRVSLKRPKYSRKAYAQSFLMKTMEEDAKNGKFIMQGEGQRKRGVSSWTSIMETELQKQYTASP